MPSVPQPFQHAIDWAVSLEPVAYERAVEVMEERVQLIADRRAPELIWLLEHPPLYTAGTSTKAGDLLDAGRFPVHCTGRGGQLTYHGPGQRVVYVMLDLKRRFGGDVRAFVATLERWIIRSLADFGIKGEVRRERVGVWVAKGEAPGGEAKIAAIGVRVRRGVSYHGLSLNVATDLSHYGGIVPCGIQAFGVTSLADLGISDVIKDVDISLKGAIEADLGPLNTTSSPGILPARA